MDEKTLFARIIEAVTQQPMTPREVAAEIKHDRVDVISAEMVQLHEAGKVKVVGTKAASGGVGRRTYVYALAEEPVDG